MPHWTARPRCWTQWPSRTRSAARQAATASANFHAKIVELNLLAPLIVAQAANDVGRDLLGLLHRDFRGDEDLAREAAASLDEESQGLLTFRFHVVSIRAGSPGDQGV